MRTQTRSRAAAVLAVAAVGWMLRPGGFVDGPVLVTLTKRHGVHVGDLLAVFLALGAAVAARPRRP